MTQDQEELLEMCRPREDGEVEMEMELESRQWRLEGGGLGLRAIVKSQGVLIMG